MSKIKSSAALSIALLFALAIIGVSVSSAFAPAAPTAASRPAPVSVVKRAAAFTAANRAFVPTYPVTPWVRIPATGAEDISDNPITTAGTAVHHVRDSINNTEHNVTGTITYEIDESGTPYLKPASGGYITVTLPSAQLWKDLSFLSVFEPASVILPNNSFLNVWSTVITTAGGLCRWSVATCGLNPSVVAGGSWVGNDGGSRVLTKRGAGIYTAGELDGGRFPVHCRNIVASRVSTTWRCYINSTDLEVTTSATSNTVTHDSIFLFRNSVTTTINFNGGRFYEHVIWNSVLSDTNLKDSLTAARVDYPFLTTVNTTVPLILMHGSSLTFGFGSATAATWWKYIQTNFGKSIQMFVLGGPGEGINDIYSEYVALIQPIKTSLPKRTIVFFEGQINRIRTDTQTAATAWSDTVTFANAVASDFPSGWAVTMNTLPRTTRNAELETFDASYSTYFNTTPILTNTFRGNGTTITNRCFMVDMRNLTTTIGGDGDDTTGTAALYSATDGTPRNNHEQYNPDSIHMNGTDASKPGQVYLATNSLPIFRYLTRPYSLMQVSKNK